MPVYVIKYAGKYVDVEYAQNPNQLKNVVLDRLSYDIVQGEKWPSGKKMPRSILRKLAGKLRNK